MNPNDLHNLLAFGEGFTTEFKRSGTSNLGRQICAFAMLHRMEAVEHIGSGIKRIRNLCREYGVAEPKIEVSEHWFTVVFPRQIVQSADDVAQPTPEATPEVTPEVREMLSLLDGEMTRRDIMHALQLSDEKHFREHYQQVAIRLKLMEMTIPEKPRSRNQRYRLTDKGRQLLERENKA